MDRNRSGGFGEILQRHRLDAGLTQEELAERARISARAISDLERGAKTRPHLATVRQLSDGLQLSDVDRDRFLHAAREQPHREDGKGRASSAAPCVRTFLIADVRGYTQFTLEHGDEAAARLATCFAQIVEETVATWNGRVVELRGDEVLVVFSSARQALQAAVEIQARLLEDRELFPLGVGIGLDSGEAIAVNEGYRGAALNLAARLCSLARAGEVLTSQAVTHLARKVGGLVYSERGDVHLKGFSEPVTVIQVTEALQSSRDTGEDPPIMGKQKLPTGGFLGSLPSGALVAREEERAHLMGALEAVTSGEGRLLLLAGEPGIGKTRLAQELTLVAQERGLLIAAGRCYEPQQSVPYYPFLDALSMAYAASPTSLQDQTSHRWPYLARLLPDALGSTTVLTGDGPEEQIRLLRAVSSFLIALAEIRPIVLVLDDLHWADGASLHLLQHLARQTRAGRVLLLGTYRDVEVHPDHPLQEVLRDLARDQVMERITLKRLGRAETSSFVQQTMGEVEAEAEVAAFVYDRTDGNPFFTQQVLHALVENGSIYRQDGRWKRRSIGELEVPQSVRSVITQRVSRLRPEAKEMLQEASILGPAFAFDDLLRMKTPMEDGANVESVIDTALADAAAIGLVRVTEPDGYAFDHALTQQSLYSMLSPRRRRRLHLAAGEAMEHLPQRARNQRAAEVAWHFLQADDRSRAVGYLLLAGDGAEAVFAHAEAERQYRMALASAREIGDSHYEVEALEKLGLVLRTAGKYGEARVVLEEAAGMHHAAQDLSAYGRVVAQIGLLSHLSGLPEEGISRLQPLTRELEPHGPSQGLALLYAALVRLYNHTGRQSDQLEASRKLLRLAHQLEDARLLAEAELHQGVSLMHLGRYDEALQVLQSAIPRAEQVGDLHTVCIALRFCALVYHSRNDVDKAKLFHARAVDVAERLGDPQEISHRAVEAAYFTFLIGDWVRSRAYAERAVSSALETESLRAFVQPLFTLGELSLYMGAWEEAAGYLQECVTIAQHLGLADHLREVQALLAEKDLLDGNREAALDRLQPLLLVPGWEEHLNFLLLLAHIRLEVGDLVGAAEVVAKAVAETTRQRLPIGLVDALRIQGAIAGRRAAWEEAESRLHRAIRLAHEITYLWGEARALYELGLVLERKGQVETAREQLERASALFRQLGAEPFRSRADDAAAALTA